MKRLESRIASKSFAKKILATTRAAIDTDAVYRGFVLMEFCEDGTVKTAAHIQYNNNWRGQSDSFQFGDLTEDTE